MISKQCKCHMINKRQIVAKIHGRKRIEPRHEISNNVMCTNSKDSDQPTQTGSQIRAFASRLSTPYSMIVKLLTEHHLEFLSLKGGCRGSYESTHIKMPHC